MAFLSILVFGAALAVSVWAIYATVAPEAARILDLLANGPVAAPTLPAPVPARSSLRDVRVRGVAARSTLRAAA